jgi:hypothetical protein
VAIVLAIVGSRGSCWTGPFIDMDPGAHRRRSTTMNSNQCLDDVTQWRARTERMLLRERMAITATGGRQWTNK